MTGNPNLLEERASGAMQTPHLPIRAQTHIFLVRTSRCAIHSLIRTLPMLSHRHWLKIQGISVSHFSKLLSSLRHVLVTCAFCSFPPVVPPPTCSLSRRSTSTTSLERTRLTPCSSVQWSGMSGCLANPIPNTSPCDLNVARGGPCDGREGSGRLVVCPTSAGKRERYRHTGSEVTYIVGHPIVVCLVTEAAPRTHQNGQLTELGYQLVLRKTYIV